MAKCCRPILQKYNKSFVLFVSLCFNSNTSTDAFFDSPVGFSIHPVPSLAKEGSFLSPPSPSREGLNWDKPSFFW